MTSWSWQGAVSRVSLGNSTSKTFTFVAAMISIGKKLIAGLAPGEGVARAAVAGVGVAGR